MKRIVTTFLFISLFLCVYARGNAAESHDDSAVSVPHVAL